VQAHGGHALGVSDQEFRGVIGRTVGESTPWWPAPNIAAEGSPDIVLIVVDDVGFADFGCYGSDLDTRHIDQLASIGVRFNNFHTTALCSPTRACLLTGRNHHSVGMGVVSNWDTGFPGYRGRVSKEAPTLAEMVRPAGYATMAVGKWHLAPIEETTAAGPYDQWPLQRGFNRFYGFLDGATNQWAPDLVYDNHRVDPPDRDGYHLSEDLVDRSIEFIRDHVSVLPEQPYFLYLCFGTAHSPLHAPALYIEKYQGAYDRGWDSCRDAILARQLDLGVVPAGTDLAPRNPGVRPWADLSADEQRVCARLQEVYAGMIDHTDDQIGRLVDYLRATGRFDNTLLVLLSDNGATLEGGGMGSVNYFRWVNGLPAEETAELATKLDEIGGPTTYPVYPMGWGQVSNTPLKRYKQNTHSGGIRDPLIVSWPAQLGGGGGIRSRFVHASDVAPTILELIGVDGPADIEGKSFAAGLRDPSAPTTKSVQYFEMLGNRAIWNNGWKAVTYHAPGTLFDDDRWELYHLDADFSECHDLASLHPERLTELVDLWWAEAERYRVLPLDDRILERFLVPKPRPITGRSSFTYYPGIRVPGEGAPGIVDVSYTIDAHVEQTGEGVLICHGDRFSGYSLFVKAGHLVHDYNCAGIHYLVRSEVPVPAGRHVLRYRFSRTGPLRGVGTLEIDGAPAGTVEQDRTLGVHINAVGVSVGHNPLSPVSPEYASPFRFDGVLEKVVIEIGDDGGVAGPQDILD
jgi:arylsulfatase A-like enzyme